jgi:indolepyruvate decarboxylase
MDSTVFTVADYLLTRLKQLNVTEVFQISGGYIKHFAQALEHFDGVKAIDAANGVDATHAADIFGRTRGMGAESLQYGVSTSCTFNGIAGAYVERSPVVVISAVSAIDAGQFTTMHNVPFYNSTGNLSADQEVYSHVAGAAETLSTSVGAGEKIDQLLVVAMTLKRPVYIACYEDVWGDPCARPSDMALRPTLIKSDATTLGTASKHGVRQGVYDPEWFWPPRD